MNSLVLPICCILSVFTESSLGAEPDRTTSAPELAVCQLPLVHHGQINMIDNTSVFWEGHKEEIICDEGYRVPFTKQRAIHIVCQSDGLWRDRYDLDHKEPRCERVGGCSVPMIQYSRMQDLNDFSWEHQLGEAMPGQVMPLLCKAGYTPSDTNIVCDKSGSWIMNILTGRPTCSPIICDLPESIENGGLELFPNRDIAVPRGVADGSTARYICSEGYVSDNSHKLKRVCSNGSWTGSLPRCVQLFQLSDCSPPPIVAEATYTTFPPPSKQDVIGNSDILPMESKVIYKCHPGYELWDEQSFTLFCRGGKWEGDTPSCIPVQKCGTPTGIKNGNYMPSSKFDPSDYREGVSVYYYCVNGFKMKDANHSVMQCHNGTWRGRAPECELRTHCEAPMNIPSGNYVINLYLPHYGPDTQITYECDEGYKPIGTTQLQCLHGGYWSDYPPRCLASNKYCSEPGPVNNGIYMCRPSHCDLFKIGTEVHYVCNKDYMPRDDDIMIQTCLSGGLWSGEKPFCLPVHHLAATESMPFNASTLTVVIATSCGVLGLLVVVMIVVALQRRRKPRSSRLCHPSTPPPPPYPTPPAGLVDEPDRVALIAFADGIQVVLPSYEEALRGGRHPSRLSRYSNDSTRASLRSSSSRNDYRPLPSLPSSLRNGGPQIRDMNPEHHRDHHRNSIITTTSITTRDNLSLALGSMDTVNISDGTSTSVTVDTASSNPSIATSQRAAAGSIESSSTYGSLAHDDAPLLDQNHYNSETMRSHHSGTSDIVHVANRAPGLGYDTLHSQTSRSQSESSPIVELPEENKDP